MMLLEWFTVVIVAVIIAMNVYLIILARDLLRSIRPEELEPEDT